MPNQLSHRRSAKADMNIAQHKQGVEANVVAKWSETSGRPANLIADAGSTPSEDVETG